MKQILQNIRTGATELASIPTPECRPGHLLIATRCSLISAGTERMLVEFSQSNLLAKAKAQPDKVREVLEKIHRSGLLPTLEAVFARLDQPLPLGYCNAGVVIEVGEGVTGYAIGDRVVSNGSHAEVVCVPQNLCARIPDGVSDDEAAFTVLAAVGLQGIRLANPTLGENVVVIGLGLIGLMTVQMLIANGCRVLGFDLDSQRLELARQFGAQTVDLKAETDPVMAGMAFSQGRGVDAVLITASTESDEPMHQAAQMSRKRGRIVLVGVVGLSLSRADFYEKELTFQVSCSYGPGRYDDRYERLGQDYPFGFVRWTEQRNFEAVLGLLAEQKLSVAPLISERIPFDQAPQAYQILTKNHSKLGMLLTYADSGVDLNRTVRVAAEAPILAAEQAVVGVIGAGNFATRVLLPALSKTPARLKTIASARGISATHVARKYGFQEAATDYRRILDDPEINAVFILTRHDAHARMAFEALEAGKHVFVEKPLALNREELAMVRDALERADERHFLVGFNRRFSPLSESVRVLLAERSQPLSVIYTVNAGAIPSDHWTQDPQVGGGRIIGEACHFIDLIRSWIGVPIIGLEARMMGDAPGVTVQQDKMTIILEFGDGSTGTVHYLANGSQRLPKERVEIYSEGRVLVLNDFKTLRGYGWQGFRRERVPHQDKGHRAEVTTFIERVIHGGSPLIPWHELEEVTLATFVANERAAEPARALGLAPEQV